MKSRSNTRKMKPKKQAEIIHDTYLNLFGGIEGALIRQDAELVEDLEKGL